jgi:ABC-type Na+ efflux pump permease subunit
MNQRAIRTILFKDLKLIRQNKNVLLSMIVLPVILLVVLPLIMILVISNSDLESLNSQMNELKTFIENVPPSLKAEFGDLNDQQLLIVLLTMYFLAPLYLILPLMLASVIAADSFAGERERKTMEGLLYTPITDVELFVAKLLTALIPAVMVSVLGAVVYGIVLNVAAWPVMQRIFFPNLVWVLLALWIAPAAAGLGLGGAVLLSSKVKTVQEAYQMSGFMVIPVVMLVIGQVAGVVYLSAGLAVVLGFILWLIDLGLLWLGIKTFKRGEIIARL